MNDCSIEAVEALFRGELDPTEASRVSAHIAMCPECKEELTWLQREKRFFQARKETYPAPPSLAKVLAATRVVQEPQQIKPSKKPASERSRLMIMGFGLAAAFLLGAIFLFVSRSPSPDVTADRRIPHANEAKPVPLQECYACSPASERGSSEPEAPVQTDNCETRTPSYVTFPVCGPQGDEDPPCP